ncbi:MAG: hypothetical protein Q7O66_02050 [Dehalococcoidia bacterium]|nr:hypothetical protein [Dehalococcoidia bacterium]
MEHVYLLWSIGSHVSSKDQRLIDVFASLAAAKAAEVPARRVLNWQEKITTTGELYWTISPQCADTAIKELLIEVQKIQQ